MRRNWPGEPQYYSMQRNIKTHQIAFFLDFLGGNMPTNPLACVPLISLFLCENYQNSHYLYSKFLQTSNYTLKHINKINYNMLSNILAGAAKYSIANV